MRKTYRTELEELDLSQPISVTTHDGKQVPAFLELGKGRFHFGYKNHINLKLDQEIIGEMEFEKPNKSIFGSSLRNCTISSFGTRKYSGVGTGLVNFAKNIAINLGYDSICLTAQTPFGLRPKNDDLLSFYEKNGFFVYREGSNFVGFRMKWVNLLTKPSEYL